ncbi:hypothetical protein K402DRAFT_464290 [Aulographum hederae CBS 113979]|uniref:Uncharacterized protein n=1 Tax=Aulographum hederae CBS 113979 TaxID=1176131 RepID=A0A6G1GXT4_9PEZI|nr:hypothetical protein K402DRAFT_464290 [Aulographum hederae CBS 113979]
MPASLTGFNSLKTVTTITVTDSAGHIAYEKVYPSGDAWLGYFGTGAPAPPPTATPSPYQYDILSNPHAAKNISPLPQIPINTTSAVLSGNVLINTTLAQSFISTRCRSDVFAQEIGAGRSYSSVADMGGGVALNMSTSYQPGCEMDHAMDVFSCLFYFGELLSPAMNFTATQKDRTGCLTYGLEASVEVSCSQGGDGVMGLAEQDAVNNINAFCGNYTGRTIPHDINSTLTLQLTWPYDDDHKAIVALEYTKNTMLCPTDYVIHQDVCRIMKPDFADRRRRE